MSGIIALTGGIGSGKSTVAQVLRAWGYAVFDCDIRARILMDEGVEIKRRIAQEIAAEVIENGAINRRTLSDIVFADKEKLLILNNIVHSAVRKDIRNWRSTLCNRPFVFVETAILYTSGLCNDVDGELRVTAPTEVRIARVMARNKFSRNQVLERIAAQTNEENPSEPLENIRILTNDNTSAVLPQLVSILSAIRK